MSKSKYEFHRNIAIIIGINDYSNGVPRLETAVPDAEELARIMQERYQYEVHLLLNQEATLENLKELIECFTNKKIPFGNNPEINDKDRILIYFAGHGIAFDAKDNQEGPVGYLIPQDASDNPDTYLKMQDFHEALLKLTCRHLLVILDCCFSGAFYWSSINRNVVPKVTVYKQVYDHYIKYRAWQVITSTSDKQTAVDVSKRGKILVDSEFHSPFAKHLFDALDKGAADLDNDGIITAHDLFNYLRKQVAIETEEYKAQTPGICPLKRHKNGEYLFLLQSEPKLQSAPPLDPNKSPYRGLESYEEEHKDLYFGRKKQIEKLYQKVKNCEKRSLTVVLGASGTGKSSLVKAGLIPFLREKKFQVNSSVQRWQILKPIRLGESPLIALKNCLSKELNFTISTLDYEQKTTEESKWFNKIINWFSIGSQPNRAKQTQELEKEIDFLSQNLRDWFNNNPDQTLLITIDQFEELITLQTRQEEKEQNNKRKQKKKQREKTQQELLLKWLSQVIGEYGDRLRIVLTLRSDFESLFQDSELKEYWTEKARFHIKEMTTSELREAITEPASQMSIFFGPADPRDGTNTLIDKLVDEVAGMPGTLPLLSFTLNELYRKFVEDINNNNNKDDRAITYIYYNDLGGVARALTQKAEQKYQDLVRQNKAYEQTIRRVMLRMVAVGGSELARRRVLKSELKYPDAENTRVLEVVKTFVDARLLVEGENTEKKPYVEPAHDALVLGWDRLLKWKQEEEKEGNLILQRQLTPAAVEWKFERSQAKGYLWHNNPRLDFLKKEFRSEENWFNELEAEFVRLSIGRKNFNTRLAWSVAISVILGLSAGLIASLIGQRNALIAQISASQQAAEANLQANQNLDALISSLNAGEKLKTSWLLKIFEPNKHLQDQVRGSLQKAVYQVQERNRIYPKQGLGNFDKVAFSPNNKLLAITHLDGKVSFWDRYGKHLQEYPSFDVGKQISSISFSSDNRQLITVDYEEKVKWWNLLNGKEVSSPFQIPSNTEQIMIDYNGNLLAVSENNKVILQNLENGTKVTEFDSKNSYYYQYSPDGQFIATTNSDMGKIFINRINYRKNKNRNSNNDVTVLKTKHIFNSNIPVSIRFSPDSKLIATAGSQDDTICLWDLKGNQLAKFKAGQGGVTNINFSLDGKQLATVGKDNTVRIWQNLEGKQIAELRVDSQEVTSVGVSSDTYLLAVGYNGGIVRLFNWMKQPGLEQFENQKPIKVPVLREKPVPQIEELLFSQDKRLLAIGDNQGSLELWDLDTNRTKIKLESLNILVDTGSFNGNNYGSLRLGLSFSHDGHFLAFIDNKHNIKIINTKQLKTFGPFPTNKPKKEDNLSYNRQSSAFNLDGNLLATGWLDGSVEVWDWNNKRSKFPLLDSHKGQIVSIAFSPKGDLFATAGMDGSISIVRFWNLKGQKRAEFKGHQGLINKVIFSPDGNLLATAGIDGTARLWNLSGQQLAEFKGYVPIESIAFSKDGKQLATVGYTNDYHQPFPNDFQLPYRLLQAKLWQVENLDELMERGCNWAKDYLKNSSEVNNNDRRLCDGINEPEKHGEISRGNKILVPTLTNPDKQAGVEAIAIGNFTTAIKHLEASLKSNLNDPEAIIYLNNARIGKQRSRTIAVSVPISSDVNGSLEILRGVAQAQDDYNNWAKTQNGIVPIRVLIADDHNDPKLAKEIATNLAKDSDVLGVVGHFSSGVTREAAQVYNDKKLAAISPVSTSVELSDVLGKYIFRTVPNDNVAAENLANYTLKSLNKQNALVFYNSQSEYSKSLSSQFESAITSKGGKVEKIDLAKPKFDVTNSLKNVDNNTVLALLVDTSQLDQIFGVVKANSGKLPMLAGDALYGPPLLEKGGEQVLGMVVAIPWHIKNPRYLKFSNSSKKLWGDRDISWRTVTAYDAAKALMAAIKQNPNREQVAETLKAKDFKAQGAIEKVVFSSGERKGDIIELVKIVKSGLKSSSGYDYEFVPVENSTNSNQVTKPKTSK